MATAAKGKSTAKTKLPAAAIKPKNPFKSKAKPEWTKVKVGRKPEYRPEFCQRATGLAMLGLRDDDMAAAFNVDPSTYSRWLVEHPEFQDSVNAGKLDADAEVAQTLFKRATGRVKIPAVKIFLRADDPAPVYAPYVETPPPDTNAIRMWLHNRRPKDWRERREVEVTGGIEFRIGQMSPDERLTRLKELQAKASLIIEGEATEIPGADE